MFSLEKTEQLILNWENTLFKTQFLTNFYRIASGSQFQKRSASLRPSFALEGRRGRGWGVLQRDVTCKCFLVKLSIWLRYLNKSTSKNLVQSVKHILWACFFQKIVPTFFYGSDNFFYFNFEWKIKVLSCQMFMFRYLLKSCCKGNKIKKCFFYDGIIFI